MAGARVLACNGRHDRCRPWGWRLLTSGRSEQGSEEFFQAILVPRAHYFEPVASETHLEVYASSSSICGQAQIGDAGEHWRAHPHAGVVALCPKCAERLYESQGKGTTL
jgi:hypothetical protein